jgi:hypothetical protein
MRAQAQVACNTLPNVVYMQVGDTQEPLMKSLGQKLRANTPNPLTIVYKTSGSCTNIDAFYNDTKLTTNPLYIPSATEDSTWDPSKPSPTCTIDAAGVPLDLAVSATFVSSCNTDPPPAGVKLFTGPIQPYVFVVPEASTQKAITAEEAYFTFGFGQTANIDPWNDETHMFIRTTTKSTLITLAAAIDVPAAKWKGVPFDKSADVTNAVATSAKPEQTIGILGAEIYDKNRATLNALAFKAFGQRYAYYPDSTSQSLDKRNLRDGHYFPWAPTVYMAHVDGNGVITDARAKYIVDLVTTYTGTPAQNFDALATLMGVNLVPECAMTVQRSFEGGDFSLYSSDEPCGCFFESVVGTAPASCKTCSDNGPCGSGKCRFGYCEAR